MYHTGLLQSITLILYILLIVTKTLNTTITMEKNQTTSTYQVTSVTSAVPITKPHHSSMHEQIITLQQIWTQIRLARRHIKRQSSVIRNFYSKVKSALNGVFIYEWLPKEHLLWFENKIRHLDKHKKALILIPVLYNSLRTFSSTFEEMKTFKVEDQYIAEISVYKKRRRIIDELTNDLKEILEEVESGLYSFNLDENKITNISSVQKGENWQSKPDHTFVMLQDWGVITTYYRFLKDWRQIIGNLYGDYCNTVDVTHKCHSVLNISDSNV